MEIATVWFATEPQLSHVVLTYKNTTIDCFNNTAMKLEHLYEGATQSLRCAHFIKEMLLCKKFT